MRCDYHMHTYYSDDSTYLMEDVVKDAIALNLDEICFTDHVDYGIKQDWEDLTQEEIDVLIKENRTDILNTNYIKYINELDYLIEKYPNISIKKGLEFGMQVHTIPLYQKLFNRFNFDFIILSCHEVEDLEFWNQDFQKGRSQREYNEKYYLEILEIIKHYKDYSVLGHLDLMNRYDKIGVYPFEKVKDIITEILEIVIQDGKGIEVNTSSTRYGVKDLTPSREILKLYKQLGGVIITLGSDSHKKEHLYKEIEETKIELKKLGFEYYCSYDQMIPIFHKL